MELASQLEPHVADTGALLYRGLQDGKHVMLEGAQGTLLDLDHGTYPFVTSSNPVAGYALASAGIGPREVDRVIGIVKAYVTRVGAGPFPTEDVGRDGRTAGRARQRVRDRDRAQAPVRVVRRGARALRRPVERPDRAVRDQARRAVGVRDASGSAPAIAPTAQLYEDFPPHQSLFHKAEPVYEELDGWMEEIDEATSFEDLPKEARDVRAPPGGAGRACRSRSSRSVPRASRACRSDEGPGRRRGRPRARPRVAAGAEPARGDVARRARERRDRVGRHAASPCRPTTSPGIVGAGRARGRRPDGGRTRGAARRRPGRRADRARTRWSSGRGATPPGSRAPSRGRRTLMVRHGIPTARAGAFTEVGPAVDFVDELGGRAVVKADGLAARQGRDRGDESRGGGRRDHGRARGGRVRRRRRHGGGRGGPGGSRGVGVRAVRRRDGGRRSRCPRTQAHRRRRYRTEHRRDGRVLAAPVVGDADRGRDLGRSSRRRSRTRWRARASCITGSSTPA